MTIKKVDLTRKNLYKGQYSGQFVPKGTDGIDFNTRGKGIG